MRAAERKAILDEKLQCYAAEGWRVENRSDFQATIANGEPVNHTVNLLLTMLTAGLYGIAWLLSPGVLRALITVDESGEVLEQKI